MIMTKLDVEAAHNHIDTSTTLLKGQKQEYWKLGHYYSVDVSIIRNCCATFISTKFDKNSSPNPDLVLRGLVLVHIFTHVCLTL